jgi:hypothetical protein
MQRAVAIVDNSQKSPSVECRCCFVVSAGVIPSLRRAARHMSTLQPFHPPGAFQLNLSFRPLGGAPLKTAVNFCCEIFLTSTLISQQANYKLYHAATTPTMFAMKIISLFAVVLASVAAFTPASTCKLNLVAAQARSTSRTLNMALQPPKQQPTSGKLSAAVTDWSFSETNRFSLNFLEGSGMRQQLQTVSRLLLCCAGSGHYRARACSPSPSLLVWHALVRLVAYCSAMASVPSA